MFLLEVAGRRAKMSIIEADDYEVEKVETEESNKRYLYEHKAVLFAMGPKVFECLFHLF
jgi:hypothetical protein